MVPTIEAPCFGASHAVVVGLNYPGQPWCLQNAVPDAQALATRLAGPPHNYTVHPLYDQDATQRAILDCLAGLTLGADDRLLFYFAGHGLSQDIDPQDQDQHLEGYLLPYDATPTAPASWLKMADVRAALAKLPCRHLLVILDCCFAGLIRAAATRDLVLPPRLYQERYTLYTSSRARQLLTSTGAAQKASDVAGRALGQREDREGHSPFARALFRGLGGDAAWPIPGQPPQGVITAQELGLYLRTVVEGWSYVAGQPQTPLLGPLDPSDETDEGQYIFFLPGFDPQKLMHAPAFDPAHNPYRGTAPLTAEDAAHSFFFRDPAGLKTLAAQVRSQPLTVLVGPSGCGKTSLVQAGLLPLLGQDTAAAWVLPAPIRPGPAPLPALAGLPAAGLPGATLRERLAAWASAHPGAHLLLVVDALEDLITQGVEASQQAAFLRELADAVQAHGAWLHLLLVVRADAEAALVAAPGTPLAAGCPSDRPAAWRCPVDGLRGLTPDELPLAITGPAANAWLVLDPADTLVKRLLADVGTGDGATPWLSATLQALYQKCWEQNTPRVLTLDGYQALTYQGQVGVAALVCRQADAVAQALKSVGSEDALRRIVLRLVTVQGSEYTPRRARLDEVDYTTDPAMRAVVERLVAARLVTVGASPELGAYIEPAHPALVAAWAPVAGWVTAAQETLGLGLQAQLAAAASAGWTLAGPGVGLLWTDSPYLLQATEAQARDPARFSQGERAFVAASGARKRTNQRVRRILVAGLGVLTLLALAAALIALNQRQEAQTQQGIAVAAGSTAVAGQATIAIQATAVENQRAAAVAGQATAVSAQAIAQAQSRVARAQALAANAVVQTDGDPELALLLGMQAISTTRVLSEPIVPQAEAALHQVLDTSLLLHTLHDHTNLVFRVAWSPDGKSIVTASFDKTAKVWDATTGQVRATLTGHTAEVVDAAWSPDGTSIVTASNDGTAKVWNATTGQVQATLVGHGGAVWRAAWSPDGTSIVTANNDGTAKVWDATTGQVRATLAGHRDIVEDAAWSPDGRWIVTGSADTTAKVWDATTGQVRLTLSGHNDVVWTVAWRLDGTSIVTASADGTAKVWDATTGQVWRTLSGHSQPLKGAAWSPDGMSIVTASDDGTAKVWDATTGQVRLTLAGHGGAVSSAAWSPDGTSIVTASDDRTAKVWDATSGQERVTLHGHTGLIVRAVWSPDGKSIVTASNDGTAKVWTTMIGQERTALVGHSNIVRSATWSPDGKTIVTASEDKTAKVWDATTGQVRLTFSGHTGALLSAAWSPDGTSIVTASADKTAKVWDGTTGQVRATLVGHNNVVRSAAWSPDGMSIVTASEDGMGAVWDATTGQGRLVLSGHSQVLSSAAWSPDGKSIVTASEDKTAKVWDATTGQVRLTLAGHSQPLEHAAWSPDGTRIVTASDDGTAKVWDATTGQVRLTLAGHGGAVFNAAWSPDGQWIVTASADKTAKVWDATSGRERATLYGHSDWVYSAAWSPDGKSIVTASRDGTARQYIIPIGDLMALAASRVSRVLTPDERATYLGEPLPTPAATGTLQPLTRSTPATP